jgi:hypothetical protein
MTYMILVDASVNNWNDVVTTTLLYTDRVMVRQPNIAVMRKASSKMILYYLNLIVIIPETIQAMAIVQDVTMVLSNVASLKASK